MVEITFEKRPEMGAFTVRADRKLLREIDAIAKTRQLSRASVIRSGLRMVQSVCKAELTKDEAHDQSDQQQSAFDSIDAASG